MLLADAKEDGRRHRKIAAAMMKRCIAPAALTIVLAAGGYMPAKLAYGWVRSALLIGSL